MGRWTFEKVEFLYKVDLNLLLEIGLDDLYEEVNCYYWEQQDLPEAEILDMRWYVESCDKEGQTITLKIVGHIANEREQVSENEK